MLCDKPDELSPQHPILNLKLDSAGLRNPIYQTLSKHPSLTFISPSSHIHQIRFHGDGNIRRQSPRSCCPNQKNCARWEVKKSERRIDASICGMKKASCLPDEFIV